MGVSVLSQLPTRAPLPRWLLCRSRSKACSAAPAALPTRREAWWPCALLPGMLRVDDLVGVAGVSPRKDQDTDSAGEFPSISHAFRRKIAANRTKKR